MNSLKVTLRLQCKSENFINPERVEKRKKERNEIEKNTSIILSAGNGSIYVCGMFAIWRRDSL